MLLAIVLGACGSGVKKGAPAPATSTPTTGRKAPDVPGLGTGVTATQIKLGVILVDYTCIEGAVDSIYVNQQQAYNAYIDDINEHGGINGRKIVPIYKSVCPVPPDL